MNITYCDHCNLSIPDAHLSTGRAVRVGAAVFCESCKSVVGVPTEPTIPVASPARSSNSRNRAVKSGISAVELPKAPVAATAAPAINNLPYIAGSIVALLALGVFWQVFVSSDGAPEAVKGSNSAAQTTPVTATPPRKDPVAAPVSTPTPPAPAADPAVQAKNVEDAASAELDKLVVELKEGDKAAKVKRVEAFLTTHGDTFAGARARVMLKNLNATGSIDPPAYVPPPPAPPAPPQPAPPPPPPPPPAQK